MSDEIESMWTAQKPESSIAKLLEFAHEIGVVDRIKVLRLGQFAYAAVVQEIERPYRDSLLETLGFHSVILYVFNGRRVPVVLDKKLGDAAFEFDLEER